MTHGNLFIALRSDKGRATTNTYLCNTTNDPKKSQNYEFSST